MLLALQLGCGFLPYPAYDFVNHKVKSDQVNTQQYRVRGGNIGPGAKVLRIYMVVLYLHYQDWLLVANEAKTLPSEPKITLLVYHFGEL